MPRVWGIYLPSEDSRMPTFRCDHTVGCQTCQTAGWCTRYDGPQLPQPLRAEATTHVRRVVNYKEFYDNLCKLPARGFQTTRVSWKLPARVFCRFPPPEFCQICKFMHEMANTEILPQTNSLSFSLPTLRQKSLFEANTCSHLAFFFGNAQTKVLAGYLSFTKTSTRG